jgi:hypothetical protein
VVGDAEHLVATGGTEQAARGRLAPGWFWRTAGGLCLLQAIVLVIAISHGWYYNDDFALLMNASHRSLGWNYLKMPINDHLLPGERLEFWLLRHTAPLNFPVTVAVRVLLQVIASWLLIRLLVQLAGPRRRVLVVAALYCFCPLVVTNALWLTVALSLLPAQAFMLGALLWHVRYTVTGRLRHAAGVGLCLLASALFWEKAAVAVLLLPVLSLSYLHAGTLRARLAGCLRQWAGWLVTLAPVAAFGGYFLAAGYGGATQSVRASDLLRVLWQQWSRVVAPSLFGGPWRWFNFPGVSLGYAMSSTAIAVLVQLGFAVLVLLGIRLVGWKSLIGWLLPALPLLAGTTVVTLGRFHAFGVLIATTLRYGADLAVPLFLGLALALTPTSAAAIRQRVAGTEPAGEVADDRRGRRRARSGRRPAAVALAGRRPAAVALVLLATAWLIGAGISVTSFDRQWAANPTHRYVRTLTAAIDAAGPSLNLYDTTVSQRVLPTFFGPHWHFSDFLPLTGRKPLLDAPGTEPLLVDDDGRPVPAAFVPAATRGPPAGGLCSYLVQGAGTFRIPFSTPAPEGDGFLRLDYLQQRPSVATVSVLDVHGAERQPVTGGRVLFADLLSHVTLRLPITSVASVVIRTQAPDTHLCLGRLTVGAPFPIGTGG